MLIKIEEELNRFNTKTYSIIFLICTISIIIKIYFALGIHAPTPDLLVYLIEATKFSNGELEIGNRFVWPLFLSIFFNLFNFDTLIDYANLMKVISISISTISIPIIFLISKSTLILANFGNKLIFLILIILDDIFLLFFEKSSI